MPATLLTVTTNAIMSGETGYNRRGNAISARISNLLCTLTPSTYDEISPEIEYWIEYALTGLSVDPDELVERLSPLAWDNRSSEANTSIARFLKEFRDAPHRSEQARSWVNGFCSSILLWFRAAVAEDLMQGGCNAGKVTRREGEGFIWVASFAGHLIECGVLEHDLVRRHLIKPLIANHHAGTDDIGRSIRAMAIYELFVVAKNTLLQGIIEPEDVEACFKTLDTKISLEIGGPDAVKLNVRSPTYPCASRRNPSANL